MTTVTPINQNRQFAHRFKPVTQMKAKYTQDEWSQREQEYIDSVGSIVIPDEPNPRDILSINAMIDSINTIARIEHATYKRLFEKFSRRRKNSETEVYVIVKNNLPVDVNGNVEKKTESEMKSLGTRYLTTTPDKDFGSGVYTIYQLVDMAEERYIFMDAVIRLLDDKAGIMITDSGAMKLEARVG